VKKILLTLCAVLVAIGFSTIAYSAEVLVSGAESSSYAVMRPDFETMVRWKQAYEKAPKAYIDEDVGAALTNARKAGRSSSLSLLNHLDYIPAQRNQGSCGNCWAWASTGVLEIAQSVQEIARNRNSLQFLNSCYTDFYPCQGGTIFDFAGWYGETGYSIPWSNSHASWQDGSASCGGGSSSCVSCNSIATSPNYRMNTIGAEQIATQDISQETAISNIKNVLNQNKAMYFGFYLTDDASWNAFYDFWGNHTEATLWTPDAYCGRTWVEGEGAGHAVLIVGYNDDDADTSKHYWIVLNSWGTTTGRRTGLFRMPIYMNYACSMDYYGGPYGTREFWTLNVTFPNCSYTVTSTSPVIYNFGGGTATVRIQASSTSCPAPTVTPNGAWLTASGLTWRNGRGTVKIKAAANTSSLERAADVSINGTPLPTNQKAKPCTFGAFVPPRATVTKAGENGKTFSIVTNPSDCAWTATADAAAPWLQVTSGAGISGGQVTYNVPANPGRTRTGRINVIMDLRTTMKKVFNVTQTNR
jgi:C1A family cysteine protease